MSLGKGSDPLNEDELPYVYEHRISDMAILHSLQFLRGDGGCGSHGVPLPASLPIQSELQPTGHVDYQIARQADLPAVLNDREFCTV